MVSKIPKNDLLSLNPDFQTFFLGNYSVISALNVQIEYFQLVANRLIAKMRTVFNA